MTKKDWYSPGSIKYTKPQVRWLIPHLPLLGQGIYPRRYKETGYTDNQTDQRQKNNQAPFIKAIEIRAELMKRIELAFQDGLIMEFLYSIEPDDEVFVINHIAKCLHLDNREVTQRIRNALYFVSGSDRKTGSYKQYCIDNYSYLRIR